jgi:hypothetical protein
MSKADAALDRDPGFQPANQARVFGKSSIATNHRGSE